MRVQVYVPSTWEDSDPRYIQNAEEVKLRSMSTKVHRHLEYTHTLYFLKIISVVHVPPSLSKGTP